MVEVLQLRRLHLREIGFGTDDRPSVGMELVRGAHQLLVQDPLRPILARLHLVAHHRTLAVELLGSDPQVAHGVGEPAHQPLLVRAAGGELRVVVGPVVGGRAVPTHAAPAELLLRVGMRVGSLEQHVLEQVRHAGFAGAFMARADPVHHVHRHHRPRAVGTEQDAQPVVEPVFGDALDGDDLLRGRRRGGSDDARCLLPCGGGGGKQREDGDRRQQPSRRTHGADREERDQRRVSSKGAGRPRRQCRRGPAWAGKVVAGGRAPQFTSPHRGTRARTPRIPSRMLRSCSLRRMPCAASVRRSAGPCRPPCTCLRRCRRS